MKPLSGLDVLLAKAHLPPPRLFLRFSSPPKMDDLRNAFLKIVRNDPAWHASIRRAFGWRRLAAVGETPDQWLAQRLCIIEDKTLLSMDGVAGFFNTSTNVVSETFPWYAVVFNPALPGQAAAGPGQAISGLYLEWHHSLCDGIRIVRFLHSLADAGAIIATDTVPENRARSGRGETIANPDRLRPEPAGGGKAPDTVFLELDRKLLLPFGGVKKALKTAVADVLKTNGNRTRTGVMIGLAGRREGGSATSGNHFDFHVSDTSGEHAVERSQKPLVTRYLRKTSRRLFLLAALLPESWINALIRRLGTGFDAQFSVIPARKAWPEIAGTRVTGIFGAAPAIPNISVHVTAFSSAERIFIGLSCDPASGLDCRSLAEQISGCFKS